MLYDIAIINDTLAYAVGDIMLKDSIGQIDPILYNFASWNGSTWMIRRIPYNYNGIQTYQHIPWVYEVGANDIWFGNSTHWDGTQFQNISIGNSVFYGVGTNKMWGTKSNLYAVGDKGTMAQYNGGGWQKIQTGTSLHVWDIFGSRETVLAVASNPGESYDTKILQINGSTVKPLSTDPIHWPLSSVWFVPGHYYVVGRGIYEKHSLFENIWHQDSVDSDNFFNCIRGNAWNDFFVAGGYGQLLHFNGKSWRSYRNVLALQSGRMGNIAVKGNLMMGVGSLGSKAVVFIGRRQN